MPSSPLPPDRMTDATPALIRPAEVPGPAAKAGLATPEARTGRCECGHITYKVTGLPDDPHLCFPDD